MYLSNPYALSWLLLALPLVALYLLRVRPRLQPVSTVSLWEQVMPDSRPRRWWQRLRHPLSLFVQLLLLALLALSLADPQSSGNVARRIIWVVLDNSASMQAKDTAPDRFTVAKGHVHQLIDRMESQDQMALIRAGTTADLVCGLTSRKRLLKRHLARLSATDGPGRLQDAVNMAQDLSTQTADSVIFVVTDPGGRAEVQNVPSEPPLRWIECGDRAANIAVTQFQVRRQALDPIGFECLVEVTCFDDKPAKRRLRFELDGRLLDVVPLEIPPQQSVLKIRSYASVQGGRLEVSVDGSDALSVDDRAVAWLVPRPMRRITAVTHGDWYLENVLSALPLVELTVESDAAQDPENDSVSIFHHVDISRLPAGRSMVIQPTQSNDYWRLGSRLADAVISQPQNRSSLLTHVQLREMPAVGARALQWTGPAEVLASTVDDQPIYAIVPHDLGETLVLNLDLQGGDFAWRTSFPLLMANAVNWLFEQDANFQASFATGQLIRLDNVGTARIAPADRSAIVDGRTRDIAWEAEQPDGQIQAIGRQGREIVVGPLDQVGIWRLRSIAGGDRRGERVGPISIACNLVNRFESDLQLGAVESTANVMLGGSAGQPPWIYLVATALVFLALEWWLFQRRWVS